MKTWNEFLEYQRANNVKISTIKDQTSKLRLACEWKSLSIWKEEDFIKYITYLQERKFNGRNLKPAYIEMVKSLLKKYFVWAGKEKITTNIKIKIPKKSFKASDILTPDDVDLMIATAQLNRDKALISSLYESGSRISELLKLRVKDLEETEHGLKTLIPGDKTGEEYRACIFINSAQYLRNHILYPPLKPDDLIFDLTKDMCLKIVKKIAKEAGIKKRVYNHAFRHAQATLMMRKGYQESIIRAKLGWTGDSKMIARYVSIDGEDTINATLEKEGLIDKDGKNLNLIKSILPGTPIAIADHTPEFNRLNHENESLKQMIVEQEKMLQAHGDEIGLLKHEYQQDIQGMSIKIDQLNRYLMIALKDPKVIEDLKQRVMKK